MTVKTLTGSSIQAALAKARSQLGDDVVLMESTPATEDAPAEIAVMVDPSATEAAPQHTSKGRVPKPPSDGPSSSPTRESGTGSGSTGFGYGGEDGTTTDEPSGGASEEGRDFRRMLEREQGTGRGRVFPVSDASDEDEGGSGRGEKDASRPALGHGRSTREGRTNAERWAAHPLYDMLLNKGLRPETVTQLFDGLSDRGIDLGDDPSEDLRWAFAQSLCRRIDVADPDPAPAPLALIGPGGAGKTSLLLKLATHDHLLKGGEPVVLHLSPEEDHGTAYQNPSSLYQRHGIAVQNVRTEDEMVQALKRARSFGRVLIDTPSLPLPLDESHTALRRFERVFRRLRSLRVHFVLSATHGFNNLKAESLQHLPIQLDAASITHLDEARTWGRVVEWLITLDLPVQFVSEGPKVPGGARAFSLEWFVEDVMDL
jgi:flagellar biosynthesis protein FlhF